MLLLFIIGMPVMPGIQAYLQWRCKAIAPYDAPIRHPDVVVVQRRIAPLGRGSDTAGTAPNAKFAPSSTLPSDTLACDLRSVPLACPCVARIRLRVFAIALSDRCAAGRIGTTVVLFRPLRRQASAVGGEQG